MLNLDLVDAISFSKGCYTGQEVIARAHHRGRVKRRMQRFLNLGGGANFAPGDVRQLPDRGLRVVDAVRLDDGRCEFLAVAPLAGAEPAEDRTARRQSQATRLRRNVVAALRSARLGRSAGLQIHPLDAGGGDRFAQESGAGGGETLPPPVTSSRSVPGVFRALGLPRLQQRLAHLRRRRRRIDDAQCCPPPRAGCARATGNACSRALRPAAAARPDRKWA